LFYKKITHCIEEVDCREPKKVNIFKKRGMLGGKKMFSLSRGNGRWKKRKNNVHQMMGEIDGRRKIIQSF
jgi:hypothetical protein